MGVWIVTLDCGYEPGVEVIGVTATCDLGRLLAEAHYTKRYGETKWEWMDDENEDSEWSSAHHYDVVRYELIADAKRIPLNA